MSLIVRGGGTKALFWSDVVTFFTFSSDMLLWHAEVIHTLRIMATHAGTGPLDRFISPSCSARMSSAPPVSAGSWPCVDALETHPDHRAPTFDNGNVPSISPFISGRWRPPARRAAWSTWSSTYS